MVFWVVAGVLLECSEGLMCYSGCCGVSGWFDGGVVRVF